MTSIHLTQKAQTYLEHLCLTLPNRRVGAPGNRQATAWFAQQLSQFGWQVEMPAFDCIDWYQYGAQLCVGAIDIPVQVSPYTQGGDFIATLHTAATIEELQAQEINGKIVLLHGELAKEQIMPKHFPFYNPDHHQALVKLLEEKAPAAIIAATDRDPGLAGGLSPFPLFEDGDFDIPSVFMKAEQGALLAALTGQEAQLNIQAERQAATGHNVLGYAGPPDADRIVICAHIDAKDGTPGALDNGTGVVVLLLLAELLAEYQGQYRLEILAVNGEDYFSAPGELHYIAANQGKFDQIALAINMDCLGYHDGPTGFSLYQFPPEMDAAARQAFAAYPELFEGEAWYQSDHSVFIQQGRPALALTSEKFLSELTVNITHTIKDQPALVDYNKLVIAAQALADLLGLLGK